MRYREEMAVIITLTQRVDEHDDLGTAMLRLGPDAETTLGTLYPYAVLRYAGNELLRKESAETMVRKLMRRNGRVSSLLSCRLAQKYATSMGLGIYALRTDFDALELKAVADFLTHGHDVTAVQMARHYKVLFDRIALLRG